MRPAPKLARGQLAAWIGAERTANAENNETGGCHGGITTSLARICGMPGELLTAQPKQVPAHDPNPPSKNESGSYCQSGKINEF
jgi:hypothetical protein